MQGPLLQRARLVSLGPGGAAAEKPAIGRETHPPSGEFSLVVVVLDFGSNTSKETTAEAKKRLTAEPTAIVALSRARVREPQKIDLQI